jgi:error-prone DNA polymerase
MGAWKRSGGIGHFRDMLLEGMAARGYPSEFAERVYRQMMGFGDYGFPESHAASFALLVYDSAWLKCHEPAAFTAALLNSQPMGFYAPAQLVRDARAHGVEVRAVDAEASEWDCTLEPSGAAQPALRLGLRLVKGLTRAGAARLIEARAAGPFAGLHDLARRAELERTDLEALAAAGALAGLSGNRHLAFWDVAGVERPLPLETVKTSLAADEAPVPSADAARPLIAAPSEGENIVADYAAVGLTLGRHPLALLRETLRGSGVHSAEEVCARPDGSAVRVAGIVLMRQRPAAAGGVTFITLEDESGQVNVIVWERTAQAHREALLGARLLEVHGRLQHAEGVTHLIARRLLDRTGLLGALVTRSRDFH